jgi:hypothetical protein
MRGTRVIVRAAIVFAVAGVVSLFYDYRLALIAFAAAGMFGVYLWLLRRRYGPGYLDTPPPRPEGVHIGWMRAVGWALPFVGIGLMATGRTSLGVMTMVAAFVFLIGSFALSPAFRQAMKDEKAKSIAQYEESQRQAREPDDH